MKAVRPSATRERSLDTRLGTLNLKLRSLLTGFLEPSKMLEKALVARHPEGVSTRKVDELAQAMGMTGICAAGARLPQAPSFRRLTLPLARCDVTEDARGCPDRRGGGHIRGPSTRTEKGIVGYASSLPRPSRSGPASLMRLGATRVKLVISDAHEG